MKILLQTLNFLLVYSLVFLFDGCSIKKIAVNSVADVLSAEGTSVFATDSDLDLVGDALPFALKTMEALLQTAPDNRKLLVATASGFIQYTHAYVLWPANKLEYTDFTEAKKGRERAKRLFLRARDYGIRALELKYPGFFEMLFKNPTEAVSNVDERDVPALYWTGAAWGSAISVAKDDMSLIADLSVIKYMLEKAIELDEDWQNGALHEFFIVFDSGRSEADGGGIENAENHFKRAKELNGGCSVSPLVSVAESICVKQQDISRFRKLLSQVLEFDVDRCPEYRLSNTLAQEKAKFLLENIDYLFIVDEEEDE